MSSLKVTGKLKLSGNVKISGNKNAALSCLAASLLLPTPTKGEILADNPAIKITISNLPNIRDVKVFLDMLKNLGIRISFLNRDETELRKEMETQTKTDLEIKIPPEEARKLRASVLLLGPLLRSYQKVVFPQPGGCKIGPRPIDTHLELFKDLGMDAKQTKDGSFTVERNPAREDLGMQEIWLREASVTATENAILFAAGNRKNDLLIKNAACEPHVTTLCQLLNKMGAQIHGIGSNLLMIRSGFLMPSQRKIELEIEPDYIEALTFAVAAGITGSHITIRSIFPNHLVLISKYLKLMGLKTLFQVEKDDGSYSWNILNNGLLKINPKLREIKAEPWYGLPTDAIPLLIVLATQCDGEVEFIDYMYDGRLINLANALNNMGANIKILSNRSLLVNGPTPLKSRTQLSPDLRNGVGLVLAGLCAEGETVIQNFEIIERGYEKLPEKLIKLGAEVEVV